jgi:5'(3')-deoxyribonucleotidase
MIKNIGIDLDGTVVDFANKFVQYMGIRNGKFILNSGSQKHHEEYVEYEANNLEECYEMDMYPGAEDLIDDFCGKFDVFFITKRSHDRAEPLKSKIQKITNDWRYDNFPYVKDVFFAEDKEKYAIDKTIDLMIEDDAHNANKIAPHCPVILLSRVWNRDIPLHKNVTVVEDWEEIRFIFAHLEEFNV